MTALHGRHGNAGGCREDGGLYLVRTTRRFSGLGGIACGMAGQMRHIIKLRVLIQLPVLRNDLIKMSHPVRS